MKRFFAVLLVAGAIAVFSSCGNKENPEINSKIDQFEQTCDKTAELGRKMRSGDHSVAKEYSDAAMEMSVQAQDLAGHAYEMTTDQADRMQKAAQKVEASIRE